jgi:ATP-dependent RNA helicase MSS116
LVTLLLDCAAHIEIRDSQSLLFSATISSDVKEIASLYLNPQHKFISTVKDSDDSTHEHVDQEFLLLDAEWHLPMLAKFIVDSAQRDPNTKIICFFTTARATALAAAAVGVVIRIVAFPLTMIL